MPGEVDSSERRIIEGIDAKLDRIILGGNYFQADDIGEVVTDEQCDPGVKLFTAAGAPQPEASITSTGTYEVFRVRGGVKTSVASGLSAKEYGRVYFTYAFPTDDWDVADLVYAVFEGIIVEGVDIPTQVRYGKVVLEHSVEQVYAAVQDVAAAIGDAGIPVSTQVELTESYFGRQLLTDPDFEKNVAGAWSETGLATAVTNITKVRRGARSMKVTTTGTGGLSSNGFTNPTDGICLAEAWIYHESPVALSFDLYLYAEPPTDSELDLSPQQRNVLVQPNTWTRIYGTFGQLLFPGEYHLILSCSAASAVFYVDSCYVSRISGEELYTLLDAIKAKTDNLPAAPAAVGSAMTLAADAVSTDAVSAGVVAEIQSGLATSAGQGVTDGKVDAVKTQTAAIEVDTQDIQSRLTTAQTDLTAIKGYADILDDATSGNAAIKTAVNTRSTPADVLTQAKAALNTAVGAGQVPTAKALYDILHKNGSYTYDKSTDSLEAIRDYLTAIQNGSTTLQALADKVDQQKIGRSTQSASTTMTGSEQTLYEQSSTVPWKFEGGRIDLSGLADTRSVTIRFYQKCKSGGTYRLQSTVVLTGAADAGLYEIPMQLPIGGTSYKAVLPGVWNTFGLKVTAQQTVAGAGNLTIDHEWMDSKS